MYGGLEDWVYGASWETQFNRQSDSKVQRDSLRLKPNMIHKQYERLVYLVETATSKSPTAAYLGSSEGLDITQDRYAYGHIPININLCLSLIDLLQPYVK